MNRRLVFVSAAFAIALPLALSGCGNKGPLVLADDLPAAPTVEPVVETPAPVITTPAADDATAPPPSDDTPARRR